MTTPAEFVMVDALVDSTPRDGVASTACQRRGGHCREVLPILYIGALRAMRAELIRRWAAM
jgi:hypothetical protein